jgi:branched-subunit amino acid aminotransferase/4-amino-4-deoxychorismate lyase
VASLGTAWLDGRLCAREACAPQPGAGPACYTTARYEAGGVRHAARVVRRLARDARRLGLGPLDEALCHAGLAELGRACFGAGSGIVRLEARATRAGVRLLATARPLAPDPPQWRARVSREVHPGPRAGAGTKRAGDPVIERARVEARADGLDEVLLLDAAGRLVEGSRTSLVVRGPRDRLRTPPLARGGVEGVAREILLERVPELEEDDVPAAELARADEIVAVSAPRGARAVVALGGAAVADGRPGASAGRLAAVLDAEP